MVGSGTDFNIVGKPNYSFNEKEEEEIDFQKILDNNSNMLKFGGKIHSDKFGSRYDEFIPGWERNQYTQMKVINSALIYKRDVNINPMYNVNVCPFGADFNCGIYTKYIFKTEKKDYYLGLNIEKDKASIILSNQIGNPFVISRRCEDGGKLLVSQTNDVLYDDDTWVIISEENGIHLKFRDDGTGITLPEGPWIEVVQTPTPPGGTCTKEEQKQVCSNNEAEKEQEKQVPQKEETIEPPQKEEANEKVAESQEPKIAQPPRRRGFW
ncbi:hypothetical protein EIN_150760 [Entamoeba invadens IP1]|uniref:Uncharacterized protein n=1 Tax=Entamoeba invadens IP1 TaxID=370355 RepID=A0A0A1U8G2_ENTIV|nr:hypothetical protein EIN_150760 [Entamoeba invadens IP1]ELP91199.1 hypothetical protein EIN_150760 [Entamoeba invadens IP1]|eukprot:XP_004257970.1 hypothetical protein EIN_150760 [Entamoeba invadens IP1]